MSIATEITRLQGAKSDLATSIAAKGVTVPAATKIDGYAALVDQIQQGGSGPISDDMDILFIDIDGQNLYGYTRSEALQLTELPPLPSRDGLVCDGWNWTLQEIKDQCNAHMRASIGPLYHTVSGKDEFVYENYVEFIVKGAAAEINWGDGSAVQNAAVDDTVTHTATKNGRVRASISFASGSGYIRKVSTNEYIDDSRYIIEYYASGNYTCPQKVLGGGNILGVPGSGFVGGDWGWLMFASFKNLVFPRTGLPPMQAENYIEKCCFPGNMRQRQFPYMGKIIRRVDLPVNDSDSYLGEFAYRAPQLEVVDLPPVITDFTYNTSFSAADNTPRILIVRATTPPGISSTTFWAHIRIFVPYSADHSVLNAYKTATGWVNYASQIYELMADGDVPANLPSV